MPAAVGKPLRVAGLVLAAGSSRRMGGVNKLLAEIDGVPMVRRVVETVSASRAGTPAVVVGHQAGAVAAALAGTGARLVEAPEHAAGQSRSLAAGLAALARNAPDAFVVCLGDMPLVATATIDALIDRFDPAAAPICIPTHDGRRGNPVLWAWRYVDEIRALIGDRGARSLLHRHADSVAEVPVDDPAIHLDADTPDTLDAVRAAFSGRG